MIEENEELVSFVGPQVGMMVFCMFFSTKNDPSPLLTVSLVVDIEKLILLATIVPEPLHF